MAGHRFLDKFVGVTRLRRQIDRPYPRGQALHVLAYMTHLFRLDATQGACGMCGQERHNPISSGLLGQQIDHPREVEGRQVVLGLLYGQDCQPGAHSVDLPEALNFRPGQFGVQFEEGHHQSDVEQGRLPLAQVLDGAMSTSRTRAKRQ